MLLQLALPIAIVGIPTVSFQTIAAVESFCLQHPQRRRRRHRGSSLQETQTRRQVLLSRTGPYFKLDRFSGIIEFGDTANLVTKLEGIPQQPVRSDSIIEWLKDERGIALSIWDPKLTSDKGNSVYRLQTMPLQFVTLQVRPWVDVQMKTILDKTGNPVFTVQSIDFDPNIQILPGMQISAKALGISIEVAGQLRPSADGKSVTGSIAFQTTGNLPPPLRILPNEVLKAAADGIDSTVANFAKANFQEGAKANFKQFLRRRQTERNN
jgi:Protein of unknown function (DUF1997)